VAEEPGLRFDRIAEDYDRVRSGYPTSLVDMACAGAGLVAGSHVVEVGCGTGKLTQELVRHGLRVEAIDPGGALVEIARRRLREYNVTFHLGRFEDVELPAASFDAVFSATAFHWVDPRVGWTKAARLLRPHGVLALLAEVGGSLGELEPDVLAAWREVLPEAAAWVSRDAATLWSGAEARLADVSELWSWLMKREIASPDAGKLFVDVRLETVPVTRVESVEQVLALVRTQSAYLGLDPDRRQVLEERLRTIIERGGDTLRSTSFATLVTARATRT